MSELKVYHCHLLHNEYTEFYSKSEADKVIADLEESHKMEVEQLLMEIAELKSRIAPKQSDRPLQERLNEVCEKHGVSTLQELDWAFCMVESQIEDYSKLLIDKHKALDKMLQYKVLYKESCRDINTQERFFAKQLYHNKYKRCLAMAMWCEERSARYDALQERTGFNWSKEINFYFRWHQRWLELAENFKEAK